MRARCSRRTGTQRSSSPPKARSAAHSVRQFSCGCRTVLFQARSGRIIPDRGGLRHVRSAVVQSGDASGRPHFSTGLAGRLLSREQENRDAQSERRNFMNHYCAVRLPARSVPVEQLGNSSVPACSAHVESWSSPLGRDSPSGLFQAANPPLRGGTSRSRGTVARPPGHGAPTRTPETLRRFRQKHGGTLSLGDK